jgi:hypothetical protein
VLEVCGERRDVVAGPVGEESQEPSVAQRIRHGVDLEVLTRRLLADGVEEQLLAARNYCPGSRIPTSR